MRDRFPLLVVGIILFVSAAIIFAVKTARRGEFADSYSTYRSEKNGARALYLLAQESGLSVRRLNKSLEVIPPNVSIVSLESKKSVPELKTQDGQKNANVEESSETSEENDSDTAPDSSDKTINEQLPKSSKPVSDDDRLLEFVSRGGRILMTVSNQSSMEFLSALGVDMTVPEDVLSFRTLRPSMPSLFTQGVSEVSAPVDAYLLVPEFGVPLLQDEGNVVASLVPYGQGSVILVGSIELAANENLAREDNAQFWLSVLKSLQKDSTLVFDEFRHGFAGDHSVAEFAYKYGFHFAIAQLLLGILFWILSLRRFGKQVTLTEAFRSSLHDVLRSTSRLYQKGRHLGHTAQLLVQGVASEFASLAGKPPQAPLKDIVDALHSRGHIEHAKTLERLQERAQKVSTENDVFETAKQAAEARAQFLSHS